MKHSYKRSGFTLHSRYGLLFLYFIVGSLSLNAQQNLPLNREWGLWNLDRLPKSADRKDDTLQAIELKDVPHAVSAFYPIISPVTYQQKDKSKSWIVRKLKYESLFIVNDSADKFHLQLDPLFNFQFGEDLADKKHEKLYVNTRGFLVRGSIGKKIAFESSFYENQAAFPQYMDDYITSTNKLFPQQANYIYNVVPGQGRSKAFHTNGYDYAMASGYVSYSPNKILNIQVGNGKHFVGDGYRSLLLSDIGFNYPYARVTTTYKWLQYTNLYTSFMNLTDGGVQTPPHIERLFQKKVGSFQYLSATLLKQHVRLGLFQGMIWEAADSTNKQHVNFNTFDPVIGVNTGVYGLHNTNNILWGATLNIKITHSISLYGQYMLDDLASKSNGGDVNNKSGYQVGFKYHDLFTVKNLHIQLEYNTVRPYAYAAANNYQSYTHYNQPLAHPLGANFQELVGFLNYRVRDFFIGIQGNYIIKGTDSAAYNFGGNVFRASGVFPAGQLLQDVHTTQGLKNTIMYEDIHIGYMVNPSTNWNIVIGVTNRSDTTTKGTVNSQVVYIGMRTSLVNLYNDF